MRTNMKISPADLQALFVCSLRYGLGRQTYVVGELADMVERYMPTLSSPQREQLATEIDRAVKGAEGANRKLGADFDHTRWLALRDQLRE